MRIRANFLPAPRRAMNGSNSRASPTMAYVPRAPRVRVGKFFKSGKKTAAIETSSAREQACAAMLRLLLRLVLIASLAANGSASLAMSGADPAHDHASMMHAGHHAGLGADDAPAQEDAGACCDGPGCQCGCILPPMLARTLATGAPAAWQATPLSVPALRARPARTRPPFRPPAA